MIKLDQKKIILALIIVVIILATYIIYFITLEESEQNGNEDYDIFSISIEKSIFNLSEPIYVTFQVQNTFNKTTNISALWPFITLKYQMWDSKGRKIIMQPASGPFYPTTEVGPNEVYQKTYDIKGKMGLYYKENNEYSSEDCFEFIPDTYTFNATYTSYHLLNKWDINNAITTFYSNTITFTII